MYELIDFAVNINDRSLFIRWNSENTPLMNWLFWSTCLVICYRFKPITVQIPVQYHDNLRQPVFGTVLLNEIITNSKYFEHFLSFYFLSFYHVLFHFNLFLIWSWFPLLHASCLCHIAVFDKMYSHHSDFTQNSKHSIRAKIFFKKAVRDMFLIW